MARTIALTSVITFFLGLAVGWFARGSAGESSATSRALPVARAAAPTVGSPGAPEDSPRLEAVPNEGPSRAAVTGPLERYVGALRAASLEVTVGTGDGSIEGRVVDGQGQPIEGVDITALGPQAARETGSSVVDPRTFGRTGSTQEVDLMSRQALRMASMLRPAGKAISAADGSFAIDALVSGTYGLRVSAEDVLFQRLRPVETGNRVDIVGTRIRRLILDPRLPNGEQPSDAVAFAVGENTRPQAFAWTPECPELPVTAASAAFRVVAGERSPLPGGQWAGEFESALENVEVDAQGEEPMRIELHPVTSLFVRVEADVELDPFHKALVRLTAPGSGDSILMEKQGHADYLASGLTPGLHQLEVGRGGEPEKALEVRVERGWNELDVNLGAPERDRYLIFECRTEAGGPVADMFGVMYRARIGRSGRSSSTHSRPRNGCEYWVDLNEISPDGAAIDSLEVILSSPSMGTLAFDVIPGPNRHKVVFPEPCRLVIEVMGVRDNNLYLNVERWDESTESWRRGGRRCDVPRSGEVVPGPVAPGRARIQIFSSESVHRTDPVASEEFGLRSGSQRVQMVAQPLHDLSIFVPESYRDMRLHLLRDRVNGELRNMASPDVDAQGQLEYENLLAGRYWLQASEGASVHEMAIDVPCAPLTFTRSTPRVTRSSGSLRRASRKSPDCASAM